MPELRASMGSMSGNLEKDFETLTNYVFQMTEEIRYLMCNLDVTNFNDLGLARYENGRMQVYTSALEVKAQEIRASVEKQISLVVQDGEVNVASIVMAINQDKSEIGISADKIKMTGKTVFLSAEDVGAHGSTTIDGGRIQTGEIRAVNVVATADASGNALSSFICECEYGKSIGGIQYRKEPVDTDDQYATSEYEEKMYLFTGEHYTAEHGWKVPAIKLLSAGNLSIEAGSAEETGKKMIWMRAEPLKVAIGRTGIVWSFDLDGSLNRYNPNTGSWDTIIMGVSR